MFDLPKSSLVDKVIPKNVFDAFTNAKQKKAFKDKVLRITWKNKLSLETIHLKGMEVKEIQIFLIELKQQTEITDLLKTIQRAISYHIICIVRFESMYFVSTAAKHPHPQNEDISVIDYIFQSEWILFQDFHFNIELQGSLDIVFKNFIAQFSNNNQSQKTLDAIVAHEKERDRLEYKIKQLEAQINRTKQFNRKVELNQELNRLKSKLR